MAATNNPNDAAALAAREPPQELQEALANHPDPRTYPPRLVGLLAEKPDSETGRLWLPVDGEFFGTLYAEFKFAGVNSFEDIPKGDPPFPGYALVEITFNPDAVLEIHRRQRVPVADLLAHTRQRAVESIAAPRWPGAGSDVCIWTYHWHH
jgi:hypothetical protein